jgi:hypothetical protein
MSAVPFPWGLVAWDLGLALVMGLGSYGAYLHGDHGGALAGAVFVGLPLLLALVTFVAWVYFEVRHRRIRAEMAASRARWERARAEHEAACHQLALTLGRDMTEAMRGMARS